MLLSIKYYIIHILELLPLTMLIWTAWVILILKRKENALLTTLTTLP